ncbi:MAG: hypothetical protein J6V87_05265 [Prevotella sp.]|nr:hypothetical protein [Prevotella sp.]
MKKMLISIAMLTTAMSVKAQMTPEAWIAQFPELPSINQIIQEDKEYRRPDNEDAEIPLKDFLESVEGIMKSGAEMMGKIGESDLLHYKNVLYREKVPGTNVTKGQMAHMSKDQQERVAKQAMKGQLAQYGLSEADIKKMQSGKMSQAEQQALTNKVMAHMTGGMTVDDMRFMQGMTDKERVQFMQMSGLAESTTAKMKEDMKKSKVSQTTAKRIMGAVEEMEHTTKHVTEHKDLTHIMHYGDSLWNRKYKAKDEALHKRLGQLAAKLEELWVGQADGGKDNRAALKAVEAQAKQVKLEIWENENAYYAEYIPMYHREIGALLDYVKGTMMSAYRSWKSAYDQAYKETKEAQWMLSEAQITQPVEFYAGFLGAIADYNVKVSGKTPLDPDDARQARDTDGNPYDSVEE